MAPDQEEKQATPLSYNEITEPEVSVLFERFQKMRIEDRMNTITSFCLAKALAKESGLTHEETRLEYLKEAGRNERSMLKSDGTGGSDDDDPIFSR